MEELLIYTAVNYKTDFFVYPTVYIGHVFCASAPGDGCRLSEALTSSNRS